MTLTARYSGVCPECGERWQPGDLIRSQVVGAEHHEFWKHATCPSPELDQLLGVRAGEVSCRSCFLIHPEGECDR